jgi:hypothetical protein
MARSAQSLHHRRYACAKRRVLPPFVWPRMPSTGDAVTSTWPVSRNHSTGRVFLMPNEEFEMKLKLMVAGLVALGGIALGAGSASAMPNGLAANGQVGQSGNIEQVRLVCDEYGRCWRRPNYGYGPRYGYGRPGPRYGFGGGYGGPRRGGWDRGHGYGGGRW